MAHRVRRLFRGGRVVDMAGGHGLLAHVMLLADRSSPGALVVDSVLPVSSRRNPRCAGSVLAGAGGARRLRRGRDRRRRSSGQRCDHLVPRLRDSHRPGAAARRGRARPGWRCCRAVTTSTPVTRGGLTGWVDGPAAVDIVRAVRLSEQGYRAWTKAIPADITRQNRLLLGAPRVGYSESVTKTLLSPGERAPGEAPGRCGSQGTSRTAGRTRTRCRAGTR